MRGGSRICLSLLLVISHGALLGREVPRWASTRVEDGADNDAISVHPWASTGCSGDGEGNLRHTETGEWTGLDDHG